MAFKVGKFHVDLSHALMPLSMIVILVAYFAFKVPVWAIAIFCLWIPIYYFVYPKFLRAKWEKFDRRFGLMFQQGQYDQLLDYYRSQWFLRRFAPEGEMLSKLGLIYIALNKFREAEIVLERAAQIQPKRARDRIYVNLGNVKYELGKYADAKSVYEKVSKASPYSREIELSIALVDAREKGLNAKERRDLEQKLRVATGSTKEKISAVLEAVE